MKPKSTFLPFLLAAGSSLLAISSASAASATWNGTTDAVWATGTNWSTTPVPGTGDTATFNNAGSGTDVISLDTGVTVRSILFDTANVAAYTIGSGAVGSQTLNLDSGGNITLNDTINANQLINANVVLTGPYTLTNNDASNTLTIAGIVSGGGGGLTKSGVGTVSLTGKNTFTGGITVSTGTLVAAVGTGNDAAFTSIGANAVSIAADSTLRLDNNNTGNLDQIIGNVFTGGGLLKINLAAGVFARNTKLTGLSSFTGTIQLSNSGANADKWNIPGLGTINAALIIDSGSQLLSAGGTSTFSKGITVSGTGNSENYGAIRLYDGTLGGDIALVGNTTFGNEGNTSLTGNIIASGGNYTLTFDRGGNLTHSGNLGGDAHTLSVNKSGPSGTHTFSGSLANFTGTYTQAAGTTNLTGTAATIGTLATDWVITSGTLGVNSTATQTLAGDISGGGLFTKSGTGTLTMSGTNTYTGATTVSNGALNMQNASALGTVAAGTSVTSGAALQIQGGITTLAEALTLNGAGISATGALRNISGDNTYAGLLTLGSATRINSDSGLLTLSHTGTITGSTFGLTVGGAGNTTIRSIIGTTSGTLTKDGAGILNLTGNTANTYTGGTFVNGGKLMVNNTTGSGTGTGAVTVNDGGTLGGTGIIGGPLTVKSGGTHAPGNSPGIQSISGNTTYESGSIFAWDLNSNAIGTRGTNYDGVTVTGNLTVESGAIFRVIQNMGADFANAFWTTNQTWSDIFSVSGTLTGWDPNTPVAVYDTTNTLQNVSSYGSFTISGSTLNWSAVPEPSTALAGLLLAAGLLRRRRSISQSQ